MLAWTSSIRARDVLYTRRFSQLKPEERAALRARANAHRAAVRDDEPLHGGEPQPHARHIAVGPAHVGSEARSGRQGGKPGPGSPTSERIGPRRRRPRKAPLGPRASAGVLHA